MLNWIFPKKCVKCGFEGRDLCQDCYYGLIYKQKQECPSCRVENSFGRLCSFCEQNNYSIDQLLVSFDFYSEKAIKPLLHRFKYKFSVDLSDLFVDFLQVQSGLLNKVDYVCSVPVHSKRKKFRGFNQSEVLAVKFAQKNAFKYLNLLKKIKETPPQARLHKEERNCSQLNAFVVDEVNKLNIMNKNVVLIDDVATTCATLRECAGVLKQYGAKTVSGLVLARG